MLKTQVQRRGTMLPALLLVLGCCALPAFAASQIDIHGPVGTGAFGFSVTVLPNGNFVVTDPFFTVAGGPAYIGAVYLYDGATLAVISTLTGSRASDEVGIGGITVLPNGNFVVQSYAWSNGSNASAGAVTWGSATAGVSGAVTASNSLIGGTGNDLVGASIITLSNGNYVVNSSNWSNPVGPVSAVGAVTWCNGTGGTVGLVSAGNSLVGGTANDTVGNNGNPAFGPGPVTALTNGNYVVTSYHWTNPAGPISNAGAATWCNGTVGTTGLVTSGNSLVGGSKNDFVGFPGATALTNGHYVVSNVSWNNPVGPIFLSGAATWGNGNGGTTGFVTPSNSLVGSGSFDQVGGEVTPLSNGNYAVASSGWSNPPGTNSKVGAVTWCAGTGGTVGMVTSINSLIGGSGNDRVGSSGVTALTNGNYVVGSSGWTNGPSTNAGAATWCSGNGGTVGLVSANNSLVGGSTNDQIARRGVSFQSGQVGNDSVTALTNGNYVVISPNWNNPIGASNVGAVSWCNGLGGTVGLVTVTNSLVGGSADDQVGLRGATQVGNLSVAALSNGNYTVVSSNWNNPSGPVSKVGAVTWGNGNGGTTGLVLAGNSLIGSTANDTVGSGGVAALSNGNYAVNSVVWNNSIAPASQAGAVTWSNGSAAASGLLSPSNSLVGSTASDQVGFSGVTALKNGHYVVQTNTWNNPTGSIVVAGAVSFGNGAGSTIGPITSANSVLGTASNGVSGFSYDYFRNRLFVGRSASGIVTIFVPSLTPDHFKVTMPANALAGTSISVAVSAQDAGNAIIAGYTGTVHFTSNDATAVLPADYTFVAGDNGIHTFNVTLNTAGTTTVTATDTVTGTAAGAASVQVAPLPAPPTPPVFASLPLALPNPAIVNQAVIFSASAASSSGGITYVWSFGDTASALGASVTHSFSPAKDYTITVVATDSGSLSATATFILTINAATTGIGILPGEIDSDGDGYSDVVEAAFGTDPLNAADNPGNGVPPVKADLILAKMKFSKTKMLTLNGKLQIPASFNPTDKVLVADFGGYAQRFKLNSKASAKTVKDTFKLTLKSKKGVVMAQLAAFTLVLNAVPITVQSNAPLQIVVGNTIFSK